MKDYKLQLTVGPICKLIEAIFELFIPLITADIIDNGVRNNDIDYVLQKGALMVLLGMLGLGFALVCQKSASIASQGFGTKVRNAMFRHINTLSHSELDKIGTPSLITRMTNDINRLQLAVAMLIRLVIRAPFLVIGALIMAMTIDLRLSLIFFGAAILIALVLFVIMTRSVPFYKSIQKKLDSVSLISRENLSGNRVIRAFGRQQNDEARKVIMALLARNPDHGPANRLLAHIALTPEKNQKNDQANAPEEKQTPPKTPTPPKTGGDNVSADSGNYDQLMSKAHKLLSSGNSAQARKFFDAASKKKPTSPEPWAGLAWCALDAGQAGSAVSLFKKSLGANPRYAESMYGLAESLEKSGNKGEAIKAYNAYLQTHPNGQYAGMVQRKLNQLR